MKDTKSTHQQKTDWCRAILRKTMTGIHFLHPTRSLFSFISLFSAKSKSMRTGSAQPYIRF